MEASTTSAREVGRVLGASLGMGRASAGQDKRPTGPADHFDSGSVAATDAGEFGVGSLSLDGDAAEADTQA